MGAEPEAPPPYRRGLGREPAEGTRSSRPRGAISLELPGRAFEGGDVLLFRFREHLPAKHCAIATSRDAMIHAHDGATVCEVAIHPWWGRHLAGVFRFHLSRRERSVRGADRVRGAPSPSRP